MDYNTLASLILSPLVAFGGVWWVYFKILRLAKEKNLVDNPDARKLQKTPVPVVGGIAVFFGLACSILIASAFMPLTGLATIFGASVIMLYVGGLDDILSLSPGSRLLIEVFTILLICFGTGGGIDNFHGLWGIYEIPIFLGLPLTLVTGVGIINAVNMIDGVNGLSSGLCILFCIVFGYALILGKDYPDAILALCMCAALMPFWLHNVMGRSSKMFIGDAGTMVLGILMTWFIIQMLRTDSPLVWGERKGMCLAAFCLSVLVVPVFDTLRVMLGRMKKGIHPFQPDKTHLHHIFISYGISHSVTTFSIIGINAIVIMAWYVAYRMGLSMEVQFYLVVILGFLLVWGVYILFYYIKRRQPELLAALTRMSMVVHVEDRYWWIVVSRMLDAPENRMMNEAHIRNSVLASRNHRKFEHTADDRVDFHEVASQKEEKEPNWIPSVVVE